MKALASVLLFAKFKKVRLLGETGVSFPTGGFQLELSDYVSRIDNWPTRTATAAILTGVQHPGSMLQ